MADDRSRVLTLVFTDLADSTALKTARGDVVVGELISRHREHVTRLAEECAGRIIDWAGDGCFLTFETSSAGVMFALRLQQAHAEDKGLPGVRIGIHMGEVTEKPGPGEAPRIEGLAVDIAARVSGLAKPGQVLMSSAIYNSARQRLGVEAMGMPLLWQLHGTYELKGFDSPLDIGEAGVEGVAPLEAPKAGEKARLLKRAPKKVRRSEFSGRRPRGIAKYAALVTLITGTLILGVYLGRMVYGPTPQPGLTLDERITSLAVLPLDNLMNDPDEDYFVDGMTEAITAELSKISSLKVISRTSTARYKDTDLSMPEIARELGVEGLIEGSVLRDGDDVRITVQLIDGRSDRHLWSESYTDTITSVLKLQAKVALAIADEIRAEVEPDEQQRIAEKGDIDPGALESYLRGRLLMQSRSRRDLERAVEEFQRAIEIDDSYAQAYSGLADGYNLLATHLFVPPGEAFSKAEEAALKALALDSTLSEAYTSLGWARLYGKGDWDGAGDALEEGVSLDPNYAQGQMWYGYYLQCVGQFQEAREAFELAVQLDPHSPKAQQALAVDILSMGDVERSIRAHEALLEEVPDFAPAFQSYASALNIAGRHEEALVASEKLVALRNGDFTAVDFQTMTLAYLGRFEEAKAIIESHPMGDTAPWRRYYKALGSLDAYLNSLRGQIRSGYFPVWLLVERSLDSFRDGDRYWEFVEEYRFPRVPPGHPAYDQQQAYLARKAAADKASEPIERIAVLPFANISGDTEQEWFVDGMTEALTMELAKIGALTVVSRTSAMQYKNVIRPMNEIARELGVDALIEGSVMRVGDDVRITAQLIDGRSDKHLWADRYDGTFDDLFSLQSEVALAIAKEIDVALTPEEETRLASAGSVNPEAHEAYLRGRHIWNKRTKADILRAIEYFEEAVGLEPSFALAHSAIADAYNLLGVYIYLPPEEAFAKAVDSARRALAIDDRLADAHTSLAYALWFGYFDREASTREFERALELDPKNVQTCAWYAAAQAYTDQLDMALDLTERALALDPLSPISNGLKVLVLHYMGRDEEAIEVGRRFQEIRSGGVPLHLWLGQALEGAGDYDGAIIEFERLAEMTERHAGFLPYLGLAYAKAGRRDDALAILEEIGSGGVTEATTAYGQATVYFGLGDLERTLTFLEKAGGEWHRGNLELGADPLWAPIRDEPRFQAVLEKFDFAGAEEND